MSADVIVFIGVDVVLAGLIGWRVTMYVRRWLADRKEGPGNG